MLIYHIVLPDDWSAVSEEEFYRHESLDTEGFIHCSYADQLDTVIGRYYAGVKRLVILAIDPDRLTSGLVPEPSTGGEIYPHIYGPINIDAVIGVETRDAA